MPQRVWQPWGWWGSPCVGGWTCLRGASHQQLLQSSAWARVSNGHHGPGEQNWGKTLQGEQSRKRIEVI